MSTVHRVVNPPLEVAKDSRRQSMAFFHNLNRTAMVETIPTTITPTSPLKYEPIMVNVNRTILLTFSNELPYNPGWRLSCDETQKSNHLLSMFDNFYNKM